MTIAHLSPTFHLGGGGGVAVYPVMSQQIYYTPCLTSVNYCLIHLAVRSLGKKVLFKGVIMFLPFVSLCFHLFSWLVLFPPTPFAHSSSCGAFQKHNYKDLIFWLDLIFTSFLGKHKKQRL